jgi:small subunit ribosomal protein S17
MRTKQGIVTSDKMVNTIVVTVHSYKTHTKYHKRYRVSKKYYADNPKKTYKLGDNVTIYETRPLSKLKRWTTERSAATPPEKKI